MGRWPWSLALREKVGEDVNVIVLRYFFACILLGRNVRRELRLNTTILEIGVILCCSCASYSTSTNGTAPFDSWTTAATSWFEIL